jgi:hypothetical protein
MFERMAAEIAIGGDVPADVVPELIDEIKAQGVQVGWNKRPFKAKNANELLALARKNGKASTLLLADHEATWGSFDLLEAFLVNHKIAFDRRSEGKFGFDAELVQYRPGMKKTLVRMTSQNKKLVIEVRALLPIKKAMRMNMPVKSEYLLDRLIGPKISPLKALRIVRSPAAK